MTHARRARVVIALVVALAGLPAASAVAADGAEPQSAGQCAAGRFCVWSVAGYSGTFADVGNSFPVNLSSSAVGSVWNRSARAARLYAGANGTGSSVCYGPGAQLPSTVASGQSIRLLPTASC